MTAHPTHDRRTTLARPDFAAEHLRGLVEAPRYGRGERRRVVETAAALRREPDFATSIDTEAVFGEIFTVYDEMEGWAWGQLERDLYVGWLSANALSAGAADDAHAPTHRIRAQRTFVYPVPSIKAPPMMPLTLGSAIAVSGPSGPFLALKDWGFVFAEHAAPIDAPEDDPVAVAERFLGVPYLWGGRTSLGLDCSALVQTALQACGLDCPRDSDMQEGTLGEALDPATPLSALRRGDLLFWKGHVALVRDADTLIHATGHSMTVMVEGLAEGVARIAAAGSTLRTIRRIG
ncbi:C40 family peptidase [Labrys monachus]|uniref:Cell wall-associated NlpC family hydrolase n=1 Tax=Labrys monachus TaxID=217067 RepID=A0ABU0FP93_9HYPH|nr:NlpC/P60 family protein [Labrys monachus]MDQ0395924.1 cell wall-associated NlpC family hydrolase [Labrys monachus]